MAKLNKKINVWGIVSAIAFIYLAFIPYISNLVYNILLGTGFQYIIRNFISTVFNFNNIVHFLACLVLGIGILTKFDKIAVTVGSALLWLSSVISLILNISNSIKYDYTLGIGYYLSTAFCLIAYFLIFAVALWLTIMFFMKKPTPQIAKIATFIPVVILAIILIFSFFSNTSNVLSALTSGQAFKWTLYSIVVNSMNTFNGLVNLIGFAAVAFKFADIKSKKAKAAEAAQEIPAEEIVIENEVTE